MDARLIIGLLPIICYVGLVLWTNNYIKIRITDKTERKAYRKDQKIGKLISSLIAPVGYFTGLIYFLIYIDTSQMETLRKFTYWAQIPIFLLSAASACFDFISLREKLLELNKNSNKEKA